MSRFPKLLTGLFRDFRNSYNEGVDKIDSELDLQKKRVDDLIKGTPQPSEIVDARGGHPVLRDRLNQVDAHLAQRAITIKGGSSKEKITSEMEKAPIGSVLFFEEGVYLLSDVTISKSLTFTGHNATLKLEDAANKPMFYITGARVTFRNINIDGNKINQSGVNFNLFEVTGEKFRFEKVNVSNVYGRAIVLQHSAKYSKILDCTFEDNGVVANCNAITAKASFSLIKDNTIRNHGEGWGIIVGRLFADPDVKIENVIVTNNTVENLRHVAIGAEHDSEYCTFTDNTIRNCKQGMKFDDDQSRGHSIKGNTLVDIELTGIFCTYVPDCLLDGNLLFNISGSDGITSGPNSKVSNNLVHVVKGRGIRYNIGNTVSNNTVIDPLNDYGIGSKTASDCILDGNRVETSVAITGAILMESGQKVVAVDNVLTIKTGGSSSFGITTLSGLSNYIIKGNIMTGATTPISEIGTTPKLVEGNL